jgi:hypothetical protein
MVGQVVGQKCVVCGRFIESIVEGTFCVGCGQPVHRQCLKADTNPGSNQCDQCGTVLDDPAVIRQRLEELRSISSERKTQDALRTEYGPDYGKRRSAGRSELYIGIALTLFGFVGIFTFFGLILLGVGIVLMCRGINKITRPG